MIAPIKRLTKAEAEWLGSHFCGHGHTYLEHYGSCFRKDKPKDSPFVEKIGFFDLETSGLAADFAFIFCVNPDTMILTSDLRWKRADRVVSGDYLVGVNEFPAGEKRGEKRRLLKTIVEATEIKITPQLSIKTDAGEVDVSDQHRFLTFSPHSGGCTWKEAGKLVAGDKIRFLCQPWENDYSWDEGWLGGIADGEASLSRGVRRGNSQLVISQSQKNGLDTKIEAMLIGGGYKFTKSNGSHGMVNFHLFSRDIIRFLGKCRPERLLRKFDGMLRDGWIGLPTNPSYATVSKIKRTHSGAVCTIQTESKTLITNGFISHNSYAIRGDDGKLYGRTLTPAEIRKGAFDKNLVREMCADLKRFHRVVVHYGGDRRFDCPFARTRALKHGLDFPLYKDIWVSDTWLMAKNKLKLRSNRLGVICEFFGIAAKEHPLTPDVWQTASAGKKESLAYIWKHNVEDVDSMKKVYELLVDYAPNTKRSI